MKVVGGQVRVGLFGQVVAAGESDTTEEQMEAMAAREALETFLAMDHPTRLEGPSMSTSPQVPTLECPHTT